jgi:hypothetical protein
MARPITQREIQQQKLEISGFVNILNISKQAIHVQLKAPPNVDFFAGEQTIPLMPGKFTKFPRRRLYMDQVTNLQKSGKLRILSYSDN